MKDALKNDRARIQVGRISSFGLMEMSRQRLRTGVLEASTKPCAHCEGTGLMRTASSSGLSALRIIEEEAARGRGDRIVLRAGREAAIYLLNKKRRELGAIELRYGVTLEVMIDETFEGARMAVESSGGRPVAPQRIAAPIVDDDDDDDQVDADVDADEDEVDDEDEGEARAPSEARRDEGDGDGEGGPRRRRRRRGGRGRNRQREDGEQGEPREPRQASNEDEPSDEAGDEPRQSPVRAENESSEGGGRNRRGRRGGRGRGRRSEGGEGSTVATDEAALADMEQIGVEPLIAEEAPLADAEPVAEAKPKTRRRPKAQKAAEDLGSGPAPVAKSAPEADVANQPVPGKAEGPVPSKAEGPKRRSRAKKVDDTPLFAEETEDAAPVDAAPVGAGVEAKAPAKAKAASRAKPKATALADNDRAATADPSGNDGNDDEPRRGGWWNRTFG